MFWLCACSEDDTISLQNEYLFGELSRFSTPILRRFCFIDSFEKLFLYSIVYMEEIHLLMLLTLKFFLKH